MSQLGSRRRARVVKVDDGEELQDTNPSVGETSKSENEAVKPLFNSNPNRKTFRQSGLRKSVRYDDEDTSNAPIATARDHEGEGEEEEAESGPAVVRPAASRAGSSKARKRTIKSSQAFFGALVSEDDGQVLEQSSKTSKPTRAAVGDRGLPFRSFGDEEERPKYSKEYLAELQSSTPNTPAKESGPSDCDEMLLDASELEGATIVEALEPSTRKASETRILTDAEVQERKERRARLAKEENFLSLEDDNDEDFAMGKKKKEESRLVADEDELGEGFDDFVEDGGLSLGKRADRERKRQSRRQMAELITQAEGHSSDDSSDSDAERRMAYEAAQTRAGMDGLDMPKRKVTEHMPQVPSKVTPLPSLTECLSRLQSVLIATGNNVREKNASVDQLKREKQEVIARQAEVQTLLDETGNQYRQAMGQKPAQDGSAVPTGPAAGLIVERGLESMGTTPVRQADDEIMPHQ